ncbi:hypothetical protein LXL04_027245 [Taraxacum kok-saghyz]
MEPKPAAAFGGYTNYSWPAKGFAAYGAAITAAVAVGYAALFVRRSAKFRSQVVGIIPARYASSRFQGKPLVPILGKPMIQRTWERAKLATTLSRLGLSEKRNTMRHRSREKEDGVDCGSGEILLKERLPHFLCSSRRNSLTRKLARFAFVEINFGDGTTGETSVKNFPEKVTGDEFLIQADELEALPAETYCMWRPKADCGSSPAMTKIKKSSSTGSGSKRWGIRYLLWRSKSDGKEPVVLLTPKKQKLVVTDDERIADCCRGFGADVIITSQSCRNGTERCNEALLKLKEHFDVVVNIQGDEPLIEPDIIDGVVRVLQATSDAVFSTAVTSLKAEDACDPNRVKCVVDNNGYAIYFSRGLIPFNKSGKVNPCFPYLLHLGIQSYDAKFLKIYPELPPTPLQLEEDLEQLKVLENGYKMKVIKVDHAAHGVDTPEDVEKIESLIRERNL